MTAQATRLKALAIAALSAWLASCATAPSTVTETPAPPDQQAREADFGGNYEMAANYWLQAAATASPTLSQSYRLNAAESWLKAGDPQKAFGILEDLQETALSALDRQRFHLIASERALAEGNVPAALDHIDLQESWLDPDLELRAMAIRSRIEQLQSGAGSELLARLSADLGPVASFNLTAAVELLTRYEYVPSGKLREASMLSELNPRAASWAELIARLRQGMLRENQLTMNASDWARDYPQHEIGRDEFLELAYLYSQRFTAPANIAVLLPTRGGLTAAGSAIRDGLLSAYLENPGHSELKFYESGESPAEALAAYRTALENGAEWVIGPVRQGSVQAVAAARPRAAATLALNDLSRDEPAAPTDGFFTLSLSQEAEAAAIAGKMLESGIEKVITLTTENAWGNRMETAFIEAFTAGGGRVVDIARFTADASDHSAALTQVLQIDQSRARKERLQALLGTNLSFEPRLRDDFDGFFLSSVPEQARQIRPQLRFFEAGDKPLFAVSRVYSGTPDPTADSDLNGTVLPLGALQLEAATSATPGVASVRGGSMLQLYALGRDAWDLVKWLPMLRLDPDLAFPGATGMLKLDHGGRLDREPAWAMFVDGKPLAYDPANRP